jgi:conjugal transfer pilus assembly protein TraD
VLGNINNLIAMRVIDAETQEYVADSLPKTRLKSVLLTQGSTTHTGNPLLYTGNVGERLGEEEGDLFPRRCSGSCPTCIIWPCWPAGARQGAPADPRHAQGRLMAHRRNQTADPAGHW